MEKMSPERAMEILKNNGFKMKTEDVKVALEFLRKLSAIIVSNYLINQNKIHDST